MNTLWKVLVGVIAILVIAMIGVALTVALIFDPNDYRPLLIKVVEENTGRNFELPGDLDLGWFPCCSVTVGPSSLSNPDGFPDDAFARFEGAALSLKVWPLITRREVQIGTVTLDGLDISLVQLADGRGNWEFETTQAAAPPTDGASGLDALNVAGIQIRDGSIRYRDLGAGTAFNANNVRIDTGAVGKDLAIPVDAALDLTDESDGTSAQLKFSTSVQLSGDLVTLDAPDLRLEASGPGIPTQQLSVAVSAGRAVMDPGADPDAPATVKLEALNLALLTPGAQLRLQGDGSLGAPNSQLSGGFEILDTSPGKLLAALGDAYQPADSRALETLSGTGVWQAGHQSIAFRDVTLKLDDTLLTGTLGIDDFDAPALHFDLQLNGIDLDRYLAEPASPGKAEVSTASAGDDPTTIPLDALNDVPLKGRLQIAQLRASGVDVTNLDLGLENTANQLSLSLNGNAAGGSFRVTGSGNIAAANPQLSGTAELVKLSPRQLLTALGEPPQTAKDSVLSNLSGTSRWRLGGRSIALESLNLLLDQTTATGSLRIDDFDRLATRVELSLDRLDLDAYLPPEDAAPEETEVETEIPVAQIRALDLAGTLKVQELTALKLKLQNVQADIRAADGVLRLAPLKASLYGGEYLGSLTIDATGPKAILSLEQQISTVQVGEILKSFFATDRVSGALSMQLTGTGKGNNINDLLEVLDGNVSLQLVDGLYRGMDIQHEIRTARSLLKKEPGPTEPDTKQTPIRSLSLSGKLAEGILGSEDLAADLPSLRLTGKGGLNLLKQTLDYRLNALVLRDKKDADSAGMADLVDLTVPLTIEGPMMAPKVGVDLQGLLTRAVRDKVENRARDLLLEKLGGSQAPTSGGGTSEASTAAADAVTDTAPEQPADPPQPAEPTEKESTRDLFKRGLRDLLKPQNPAEDGS